MPLQRYMFDTDFELDDPDARSQKPEAEDAEPPEPTYSEAELAAARAAGFAEGHAAGTAEAVAATERMTAEALARIAAEIEKITYAYRSAREAERAEALSLAGAIARRIAPSIARTAAEEDVERFIADKLQGLLEEPRVVVRLGAAQTEAVANRLEEIRRAAAFPGEIVVLGEPDLEPGDCRIEWADGGLDRQLSRKLDEIDSLIEGFFVQSPQDRAPNEAAQPDAAPEDPPAPGAADEPAPTPELSAEE